jgi:hypothetical protein
VTRSSGWASDQIWGLVCGFAEPHRSNRLLLMLNAYVDDSNLNQGHVSVLAGWVAPAATWARFSDEWAAVLDMKPRIGYFKWSEMRGNGGEFNGLSEESTSEKLRLLVNVIGEHKPFGFASAMPNALYREIFGGLPDRTIHYPYFVSFYGIIAQLVEYLSSIGSEEKVDFIFDTQHGQMDKVLASWEAFLSLAPPAARKIMGDPPIFRDDKRTLPLQAADLIAGLKREQADDVFYDRPSPDPPWGDRASNIQSLERYWTREMMMNVRNLIK